MVTMITPLPSRSSSPRTVCDC